MDEDIVVNQKATEETMAELSNRLARNVGTVADVFARWREPEVARAVLDSVLTRDVRAFRELLGLDPDPPVRDGLPDPADPPPPEIPEFPGFCSVVFEVTEKLVPREQAWVCRLRTDLSRDERIQFIAIAKRCGLVVDTPPGSGFTAVGGPGPIVPEGPCLQALAAAGLVKCDWEPVDNGVAIQFGPPTDVCAGP
jgi:hypothetical protein